MSRHAFLQLGNYEVSVESAGILKEAAGQPMAAFSMNELRRRGINPEGHVSRYIGDIGPLDSFDQIFTVGEEEARAIFELFPEVGSRITIVNRANGGVPNPWQQGEEAYKACAELLEPLMAEIARSY